MLDVGTGIGRDRARDRRRARRSARHGRSTARPTRSRSPPRTRPARASRCSSPAHDLFDGLPAGPWDLVVSNPPYVDAADLATLQPEVRDWEPHAALSAEGAVEAVARGSVERARARRRTRARGGGGAGGADGRAPRRARLRRGPRHARPRTASIGSSRADVLDATSTRSSGRSVTGSSQCCRPTRSTASSAPPSNDSPPSISTGSRGRAAIQPTAVLFASVDVGARAPPRARRA